MLIQIKIVNKLKLLFYLYYFNYKIIINLIIMSYNYLTNKNNSSTNYKSNSLDNKFNTNNDQISESNIVSKLNTNNIKAYKEQQIKTHFKNKQNLFDIDNIDNFHLKKLKTQNNLSVAYNNELNQYKHFAFIAKQVNNKNNYKNIVNFNQKLSYFNKYNNNTVHLFNSSFFAIQFLIAFIIGTGYIYKYTKKYNIIDWSKHIEFILDLEENK